MTPSKIQIWNSATRTIDDFVTIDPGVVRIYVCGPTVQSGPHIGHLRCALVYDVIIRWLLCEGYEVDFVQNITDIDDKILQNTHSITRGNRLQMMQHKTFILHTGVWGCFRTGQFG